MIISFGEEAITELVTNDNIEMFYFFYKKYYKNIYLNILKLVQLPQSAEDILQDVFLTFWENRNKLSSEQSISGWLFVVSYSKSLSYLKKRGREATVLFDNVALFDKVMEAPEINEAFYQQQLEILKQAVCMLPKQKQKVFRLCKLEGKSKEEAAGILGISPASVNNYLKQALKLVKQRVGG